MNHLKLFVSSFLFVFLLTGSLALAQTDALQSIIEAETVTVADLGVEDSGILPTNPFYFLKEWGRGTRLFFTFNPIGKAELELRVANQKAVELKRVQENRPEDERGLNRALENYQESQERLQSRLESLKETSQNPRVDKLLDQLTERSVRHEKLFSELEQKISYDSAKPIIQNIRSKIGDSVAAAAEKDEAVKFVSRLEKALVESPGSEIKHLRSVEIIDQLERKAPEDLRRALEILREDFSERLNNDLKEYLDKFGADATEDAVAGLPGDPARRLVLLEEIRSKAEKRVAEVLKKAAEFLDKAAKDEKMIFQKAQGQIRSAEERVGQLEKALASGQAERAVKNLLASAKENFEDAKSAFDKKQYGEAFGLARSAEVLARNGLRMLEKTEPVDLENLQAQIDRLAERIKKYEEILNNRGFTPEKNPKAFALLGNARQHLGFAKEALAKNDFAGVKLHIGHVTGFLKDLAQIIEGEVRVEAELKVLRSAAVSDRCASIQKDIVRLKESFLAKEISEADYQAKISVLQKDYERCLAPVPETVVPAPAIKPAPAVRPADSVCTLEYAPVCGTNGKTYSNSCFAKIAGAAISYRGECKSVEPLPVKEPEPVPVSAPAPAPTVAPVDKEFKFEADDSGFYEPYPAKIESVSVPKGIKIRIYFSVQEQNVYYGGLDFRSSKFQTVAVKPGKSAAVEFVADESFLISSFWPTSNVLKANLKIAVPN